MTPLADKVRASLRMGKDAAVTGKLFEVANQRHPSRAKEYYLRACRDRVSRLDRAHRFVLDASFTQYAAGASKAPPSVLEQAFAFARMPFRTVWIEWDEIVRHQALSGLDASKFAEDIAPRVGVLGESLANGTVVFEAFTEVGDRTSMMMVAPVINFDGQPPRGEGIAFLANEKDDDYTAKCLIGVGYLMEIEKRHGKAERDLGLSIARRMSDVAFGNPLGDLISRSLKGNASDLGLSDFADRLAQTSIREINGDMRWLMTVLSLMAMSRVDFRAEDTSSDARRGSTRYYHEYEHRVVTLERPMAKAFEALVTGHRTGARRRWHSVMGHWCYSKKVGDPRCDHDYEREPSGSFRCAKCGHKKWWRRDHPRGDRKIGIVDKTYEITTDRLGRVGRRQRTTKVVERLPA